MLHILVLRRILMAEGRDYLSVPCMKYETCGAAHALLPHFNRTNASCTIRRKITSNRTEIIEIGRIGLDSEFIYPNHSLAVKTFNENVNDLISLCIQSDWMIERLIEWSIAVEPGTAKIARNNFYQLCKQYGTGLFECASFAKVSIAGNR